MTTDAPATTVRKEIVVNAPVEHAFRVFTERFDEVKPREHNLMGAPIVESVFEPKIGGRLYDRGADGAICQFGRVLACEPPKRLVFTWDISPRWQVETDPARCSEVEVLFLAEGETRTRVVLEHRHLERHGEGWEGLAGAIDSGGGWPLYLQRLTEAVGGAR
jgi:uncharacterized protein YndB with AHSA1/START domain